MAFTLKVSLPPIRLFRTNQLMVSIEPLKSTSAANFPTVDLAQVGPDSMVLRPAFQTRIFAAFFMMVGLGFGGLLGFLAAQGQPLFYLAALSFPVPFLGIGLAVWISKCFEFNRATGLLSRKRGLSRREWPLSSIRALQIVYVPWESLRVWYGWDTGPDLSPTWQLNLVLDNPQEQRLNLSEHTDKIATMVQAYRLAEFLGVPVLKQPAQKSFGRRRLDLRR
jgi:hypothetical protein